MKKLIEDMQDDLGRKIDTIGLEGKARDKSTRKIFSIVAFGVLLALIVVAIVLANLYGLVSAR